jgi:hypothetical protein
MSSKTKQAADDTQAFWQAPIFWLGVAGIGLLAAVLVFVVALWPKSDAPSGPSDPHKVKSEIKQMNEMREKEKRK